MLQNKITHEFDLNGTPFKLETGEIANHAQAAFMVSYGETVVLVTVSVGNYNPDLDFFPLTVDYVEKLYAAGSISSSPYMKREGRPTDKDILNGRLIDHAIRSLFPSYFKNETHVILQVLSYDKQHDPIIASIIGVSFALTYSGVPYLGPYGATQVGYIDGKIKLNPSVSEMHGSELEMIVSSVKDGIVSVEAEVHDLSDEIVKQAIAEAIEFNKTLIEEQNKFVKKYGVKELEYEKVDKEGQDDLYKEVKTLVEAKLKEAIYIVDKMPREKAINAIRKEAKESFIERIESEELKESDFNNTFEKVAKLIVRENIMATSKRPDGRSLTDVRPLTMRLGVLPRVHGSALFSRGETQTLTVITLGTDRDAQQLQDINGEHSKRYFHHYNMPGYANGEVDRKFGFANRRAIGHGSIGEKALKNIIASESEFPYTIRVVSEVVSSNGSTSMAATCGSSLALMDAGVPVKKTIGAIGVGLVYESNDNYKILTDIIGMEDFYGDMDFKITGSRDGITAIQLDNKMSGIPQEILFEAIDQSKTARLYVIDEMEKVITESRKDTSSYAPKVKQIKIDAEKIGELIGPGGKNIKSIIEKTGVEITIDQDNSGNVSIYANTEEDFAKALRLISLTIGDMEIGSEYSAKVVRIEPFGAFVELDGTSVQGLVHVSNLGMGFVKDINEVMKLGDIITVIYQGKDEKGRIKFSGANKNKTEDGKNTEQK